MTAAAARFATAARLAAAAVVTAEQTAMAALAALRLAAARLGSAAGGLAATARLAAAARIAAELVPQVMQQTAMATLLAALGFAAARLGSAAGGLAAAARLTTAAVTVAVAADVEHAVEQFESMCVRRAGQTQHARGQRGGKDDSESHGEGSYRHVVLMTVSRPSPDRGPRSMVGVCGGALPIVGQCTIELRT